jgi:PPOX class probable F420-dependent enzyme
MSRRAQITMSDDEVAAFIAERRTVVLATLKADGRPHLVPMWFIHDGPVIEVWSFGKSQKTVNLRRDPRATLLLETGHEYDELRGVSLECQVELLEDPDEAVRIGLELQHRYGGAAPSELSQADREAFRPFAAKRVGLRFTPTRVISWDHRKLGGVY